MTAIDRALALNPKFAEAWNNRGNSLRDLARPADAVAAYGRALVLKPDSADILNNCGSALKALDRAEEALAF